MIQIAAAGRDGRSVWPAVWLVFALLAATLAAKAAFMWPDAPLLADTDDAMRLAVVQDFLAGQGWFDTVQHRLDTPYGAEMHWSRLVDLPIAALIVLLQPLAGPAAATTAAWIWPLLLLFGLLSLSALITVRLVGRDGLLPGLLLPAFSIVTLVEFAPGRIDHHSVGILLTLTMLYGVLAAPSHPRFAAVAGIAAAAALAVAIENAPSAAAAIVAVGLLWVLAPGRAAALRSFGLGLAGAALGLAALTLPAERWFVPACDAFSPVYIVASVGGGMLLVLLSVLPVQRSGARLVLGVAAGAALAGGLVLMFPSCLQGPYADLDPWLAEHWMSRVREAVPLWRSIGAAPAYVAATAIPALLALAVTASRLRFATGEERQRWLVYGTFLVLAATVMLVQVRGARVAAELAAPAGAWLILAARRRYLARRGPIEIAGLVGSWIGFAGVAVAAAVSLVVPAPAADAGSPGGAPGGTRQSCLGEGAYAALRTLPATRVMTFIDIGAHVLAFTPHEVVAAPYHRSQDGISDALSFFNRPIGEARSILDARGIGLVVICPPMPEMQGIAGAAEESFVKLYARDALPAWLVRLDASASPLVVYQVEPR